MQGGRKLTEILHRVLQARKITRFRVTGGVCPYRGMSGISTKIQQLLCVVVISKNVLFHKISSQNTGCIRPDQELPLTLPEQNPNPLIRPKQLDIPARGMFNARRVFRLCSLLLRTSLLRSRSDVIPTSVPRNAKHEVFTR